MQKIGLFFGSFNPIHNGHLAIANFFAQQSLLDEVWLVITPQNPFKSNGELTENHHRLAMVKLAIEGSKLLKACTAEFDLPTPSYTINTLKHLNDRHPKNDFSLILGQDNLVSFDRWKEYRKILDHYKIYVYPRSQSEDIPKSLSDHPNILFFEASLLEVSSSSLRKTLWKSHKSINAFVPPIVQDYIRKFNLYKE